MPLVSLDHVSLAFGHLPLLDDVVLQVEADERVSLVGRNGAGKSTLLQLLSGERVPDAGVVSVQPGVRIGRLEQDVPPSIDRSVFEVVAEGLGGISDLVAAYHRAAVQVAEGGTAAQLDTLGRLQHELERRDGWRFEQRVELVLARLALPPDVVVGTLSGGWRRRVLLARALVAQPDLLLLDEPTNHLDLDAIAWLEQFVADYPGAVAFVTHDRAFLQRVATRIVEIDRGRLSSWPGDYATFVRRKEEWLANEAVREEKFDKRLAEEEVWLRQGIKARRTRNEGRVRALMAMRAERAARRTLAGSVRLQVERAEHSGRLVFEAEGISKSYGDTVVVSDFSARVMRGDRIGLIGPNGAGKTTLLRLLLGELQPDSGEVRVGANVQVAYYDQQREQLDPERTVYETVGDGNDTVTANGRTRHVNAYLRDFLFPPERASSPVKALSGGERNRLLLARLFTRPANVLVLDEPTNDLDLETLELLEAELVSWPGTLLLVSHDRAFLDNVVTSTLVFEGGGRISEYVGGYEDWIRQRTPSRSEAEAEAPPLQSGRGSAPGLAANERRPAELGHRAHAPVDTVRAEAEVRRASLDDAGAPVAVPKDKKLSNRERRELEDLPSRIDALEREQRTLNAALEDAEFYKQGASAIEGALARLAAIESQLSDMYARWDALDSRGK
jgi:ATP-binding cassette subfamily F protein uup